MNMVKEQLPIAAEHIHQCFEARKSDELHLPPYPRLQLT